MHSSTTRHPTPQLEVIVQSCRIAADGKNLIGDLTIPAAATGVVIFAHGSGSSRHSPRNRMVADMLHSAGAGTLCFDLLTPAEAEAEARDGHLRFNIGLLARRLVQTTRWLRQQLHAQQLSLGYFGASTGAGAALVAAAELGPLIQAVVSRGGRPDLAGAALARVTAPTLLIVGERDDVVQRLNEAALELLRGERRLEVVAGATHLFEEPGTLQQVGLLAAAWFQRHLRSG